MEKHVYLVRHGESEENASHVHRGLEAELTDKGREQAEIVAGRIERLDVDVLLSSPFTRALDTARAIGEHLRREPEQSELLGEWLPPSETVGLHRDQPEMQGIFAKILGALEDPHFRHSDEETFVELTARAEAVLRMLAERPEERLCVVTHGGFLRVLMGVIVFGHDFTKKQFFDMRDRVRTWNTGVTYIVFREGTWRLITWNDLSHLG